MTPLSVTVIGVIVVTSCVAAWELDRRRLRAIGHKSRMGEMASAFVKGRSMLLIRGPRRYVYGQLGVWIGMFALCALVDQTLG